VAASPLSTSRVTSQKPTLRWELSSGVPDVTVDLCLDRACTRPIGDSVHVTGTSYALTSPLAAGVVYWRLHPGTVANVTSPTWQFTVGHRSAAVDTSWGTTLDVNGDGPPRPIKADRCRIVETLQKIPKPRQTVALLDADGIGRTLTDWSEASGIPKSTLHHRVVTRGMTTADAIALGPANYPKRAPSSARASARTEAESPFEFPANCETGVKVSMDGAASNGRNEQPAGPSTPQIPAKSSDSSARHRRFELLTYGSGGPRILRVFHGRNRGFVVSVSRSCPKRAVRSRIARCDEMLNTGGRQRGDPDAGLSAATAKLSRTAMAVSNPLESANRSLARGPRSTALRGRARRPLPAASPNRNRFVRSRTPESRTLSRLRP
jgi:hypothetical protein